MQASCYLVGHKREGGSTVRTVRRTLKKKKKKGSVISRTPLHLAQDATLSCSCRCVVFSNIMRLRSAIKCSWTGQMLDRSALWKPVGWWTRVSEGSHVICVRQAAIFPHVLSSSERFQPELDVWRVISRSFSEAAGNFEEAVSSARWAASVLE